MTPRDARQVRAFAFVRDTFGVATTTPQERALRFFEEACELAQAAGITEARAGDVMRHVFRKPPGEPHQEVGGVGVTLLAYCEAVGISADEAEQAELDRVDAIDPEYFRRRHNAKVEAGISTARAPNDDGCTCDPLANTGGGHDSTCPAWEPECTCYEMTGGHQPGCYFNRNARANGDG